MFTTKENEKENKGPSKVIVKKTFEEEGGGEGERKGGQQIFKMNR